MTCGGNSPVEELVRFMLREKVEGRKGVSQGVGLGGGRARVVVGAENISHLGAD